MKVEIKMSATKRQQLIIDKLKEAVKTIKNANPVYLLGLIEGAHYHTLESDIKDKIEAACKELKRAGFLIK